MPNIGARFEVRQPGYGETTRLPVALFDDDGAPVTGVTWDAPGMVVTCCPEGGTLADFPTFASENWREVGGGLYEVLIRGDDATERALLATPGLFYLRVVCTATSLNTALHAYKVSPADVTREDQWTDARAEAIDMLPAEVDALLSAEHGAGLWGGAAGTGAYTVTLILSDGAGRLAGGLAVAIRDLAGNTVAGPLATDTSGRVTYYLDAGDYAVVTPSTLVWLGSSTPLTVTGDTDVDITVGTRSIPLPSAPDKFVIIVNAADEFGDLVGAEAWRIRITDVQPRGLPGVDLVQLTRHEPIVLDANGQATFEIAKETRTFTLVITPRLVAGADGATEIIQVTVDPRLANEYDQIYLADLLTE